MSSVKQVTFTAGPWVFGEPRVDRRVVYMPHDITEIRSDRGVIARMYKTNFDPGRSNR